MTTIKGRRRTGSLYRRWKGKNYPVNDPIAKDKGRIYLKYKVGGKTIVQPLGTANLAEARKEQAKIMRPLELANESEMLDLTRMRLERLQTEQQKDRQNRQGPLSLDDAWAAYLASQNRPRPGHATLKGYECKWGQFVQWVHKTYPALSCMNEIGIEEAEAYAQYLSSRKLSPSSYNQHLGALALVWSVLFDKANVKINPFAWDKKKRKGIQRRSIKAEAHQRRKRPLSIKEINAVLDNAKGDYHTLILILVCTGQRLVDGVKLEWKSIDFDKKVITLIPKKTAKRSGAKVYIPLFPELEKVLRTLNQEGRYVMPNLVAKYNQNTSDVSKKIRALFASSGIQTYKDDVEVETTRHVTDAGAHSLRHTFVTIARMNGIPDSLIFQITGHSSKEMVDHYTQFSEEMVASLAGNLLGTSGQNKVRALPDGSDAAVSIEKDPASHQHDLQYAITLAKKIKGKQNQALKAELLDFLRAREKE